jgi:hypothetical protein
VPARHHRSKAITPSLLRHLINEQNPSPQLCFDIRGVPREARLARRQRGYLPFAKFKACASRLAAAWDVLPVPLH